MTCHARQHSDQMICGPCALAWDVNDPEPPTCRKTGGKGRSSGAAPVFADEPGPRLTPHDGSAPHRLAFRVIPSAMAHVPTELPEGLARDMSRAHRAARERTGSDVEAIRAAYRVFLDTVA